MPIVSPLGRLLAAEHGGREEAWAEFVAAYSALLVHTCRTLVRDRDGAMDAYAHVLEALRANDFARLRAYVPDERAKFATWLVVVARRLCLDHQRHRHGRARGDGLREQEARRARRQLEALAGAGIDTDALPAERGCEPDDALRQRELSAALDRSLAALASQDRLVLALRFDDGHSVRDVARLLGLPTVFHVYRRQAAALAALRRALAACGVEDPEP